MRARSAILPGIDTAQVLDAVADGVLAADASGTIVYANAAVERVLGFAPHALVGRPIVEVVPERMRSAHVHGFARFLNTRAPRAMGRAMRVTALCKDGTEVEVELLLSAFSTPQGDLFVASIRDLRERVELERLTRIARYARASAQIAAKLMGDLDFRGMLDAVVNSLANDFEASLALVWLYDSKSEALTLSASAPAQLRTTSSHAGIDVSTYPYKVGEVARTLEPFLGNDLSRDPQFDQEWIAREGIASAVVLPLLAGTELRGVMAAFFRHRLDDELFEILRAFGAMVTAVLHDAELFAREQTARADAEVSRHEAEASEQQYRFVTEAIPQLVWTSDATGSLDYANQRWLQYTGFTREELLGRGWEKAVHPSHEEPFLERWRAALESGGDHFEMECLLRREDGHYRWHLMRAQLLRAREGRPTKWFGTCTDIDDRKRSEEAHRFLTQASAVLVSSLDERAMLESVAHLTVPALADGCVIDVVEDAGVLRRMTAVDAREDHAAAAKRLLEIGPPPPDAAIHRVLAMQDAVLIPAFDDATLAGSARDATHREILASLGVRFGIIAPLRARGRAIGILWLYAADPARLPYGAEDLALARDLAGRVALALDNARLFRDAQNAIRLRDEFISIASHELKTPLTPLKLQLSRLRRDSLPENIASKIELADRQVDRLTRLVNQLLDVSRITSGHLAIEPEHVDLGRLVREVALDLQPDLKRAGSELRLDVAEGVTGVWDPMRLEQVVSNLFLNAIKYGRGRPIHVTLVADPDIARLTVSDHGIGIEAGDQLRVFDRFERAVSARHYGGFGLGLWIARQVVEASGGNIAVSSEPEIGSTFVVELPRTARLSSA